jgi:signal transduction histidine kinase
VGHGHASGRGDQIDQLLDLTRARLAGGVDFRHARQHVDVRALVHNAGDELRAIAPSRALAIEATGNTEIIGDPGRLTQLFSNLLANAFTHGMPDTPITVGIVSGGEAIRVAIHNEGAIAPELLPNIFEPFRRTSSSRAPEGLGLGLFIAQQIAHAHSGDLTVESTPAAGTTFTLRLPHR